MVLVGVAFVLLWLRLGIHKEVSYEDDWLDSPLTRDINIDNPNRLVSMSIPNPTPAQKLQPVMVLVHGFSASTFEFESFKKAMSASEPSVLFSNVILGGHGQDHEAFRRATYADWLAPIVAEVQALVALGYERIYMVGLSTGATGILHVLLDGLLPTESLRGLFFVDIFITPKDTNLHIVPYIQYVVKNTRSGASRPIETRHWYVNRPTSALVQLLALTKTVQTQLTQDAQRNTPPILLFTSDNDPTSDTIGSDVVADAIPNATVVRYKSNRHIIVEPQAKRDWTDEDQANFDAVINHVLMAVLQTK
jgi:carboxylesterase